MKLNPEKIDGLDPEIIILVSTDDPNIYCFTFTNGEYKGVSFVYFDLNKNYDESGQTYLEFNYRIVSNIFDVDVKNEQFKNRLGDYLVLMVNGMLGNSKS